MANVPESLLFELERYCNNYFNPKNDANSPDRDYPSAFLELAEQIEEYKKSVEKDNITTEHNVSYSYSVNLDFTSWQKAFARELSIYKRVKFM